MGYAMNNFSSKFWDYWLKRSPQNAAKPEVGGQFPDAFAEISLPPGSELLEADLQFESIRGFVSKLGTVSSAAKGPDGQLIRVRNKQSIVCTCGHVVSEREKLGGICIHCLVDVYEKLRSRRCTGIAPTDVEPLFFVCSDCAKMTRSGVLCCPKHYKTDPDGTESYLSPDDVRDLKRQNHIKTVLETLASLFCKDTPQTLNSNNQEQYNEQKNY